MGVVRLVMVVPPCQGTQAPPVLLLCHSQREASTSKSKIAAPSGKKGENKPFILKDVYWKFHVSLPVGAHWSELGHMAPARSRESWEVQSIPDGHGQIKFRDSGTEQEEGNKYWG